MILLDTNVCIAALKNDRRVLSRMVRQTGRLYLPFMVSAELKFGLDVTLSLDDRPWRGPAQRAGAELIGIKTAAHRPGSQSPANRSPKRSRP